jgi:hypothetical protein
MKLTVTVVERTITVMELRINNIQEIDVEAAFVMDGKPVQVDGPVSWSVDNPDALVIVSKSEDARKVTLRTTGIVGPVSVTAIGDVDLGQNRKIEMRGDVLIDIFESTVSVEIEAVGEPRQRLE